MSPIRNLILELDRLWATEGGEKALLRIIGSAALMLQTSYERETKDGDILEIASLTPEIKKQLLRLAGKDSTLHKKHRVYLEFVGPGSPSCLVHLNSTRSKISTRHWATSPWRSWTQPMSL